jgi:DNA-binding transcriptional LysR family regulator
MRFSLRQLQVFVSVARGESVSRAARELSMSQSAVSGSLAELERLFDLRLFERLGKRLQLSDQGRALRPLAESLCEQALELEQAFAGGYRAGELRVGATLSIGNYLCAPLMARYMKEQRGSRVTLHVANTAEIARRVKNFEIDLGLIEGELADPELEVTRWRADELCVFASPAHPLAKRQRLSDADLKRASWILREQGSGTRQTFERAMRGLLPDLHVALELEHTEAIKSAVKAGLGLGCVSRIALSDAFKHRSLVPCPVPERDFRRYFYFVLHKRKLKTNALSSFIELCRSEARQKS